MTENNIEVEAIRTNAFTNIQQKVKVKLRKVYHAGFLNSWWIEIISGGVTGYESMKTKNVKDRLEKGWHGCAGTKNRWDTLFLPPKSMQKINKWLEDKGK